MSLDPTLSSRERRRDIVAVIGTTGVGKSQLAVSLGQTVQKVQRSQHQALHTRSPLVDDNSSGTEADSDPHRSDAGHGYDSALILSADSMQLYKCLDVITNKVTTEEMGGVEHWGLDMVRVGEPSWELGRWCSEAHKKLGELPDASLPIVCGGTHYFIQHFLFPPPELSLSRTSHGEQADLSTDRTPTQRAWQPPCPLTPTPTLDSSSRTLLETFWTSQPQWPAAAIVSAETQSGNATNTASNWTDAQLLALHRLLHALDPDEAGRWHWRDGRKVKRAIERWWEEQARAQGEPQERVGFEKSVTDHAEEYDERQKVGRRARFRTLIFWVYEDMEKLRPRLDRRVDKMVENGLLREIAELRGIAAEIYGSPDAADHTEGIFQSIGFKEFASLPLPPDPNASSDPTSDPAFPSMLGRMKLSTHQYAKSQIKWIKKQLLPAIREAKEMGGELEIYVVPGGERGIQVAEGILYSFLRAEQLPNANDVGHGAAEELLGLLSVSAGGSVPDTAERRQINARRGCEICSQPQKPYSVMVKEWDIHIKSKGHKRNAQLANGGKEARIARLKEEGLRKKAEREMARQEAG